MPEIIWKIKRGNAVYLAEVENVRVDGKVTLGTGICRSFERLPLKIACVNLTICQ